MKLEAEIGVMLPQAEEGKAHQKLDARTDLVKDKLFDFG